MEARADFNRTGMTRNVVAAGLIAVAMVLGVVAGYVAAGLNQGNAAPFSHAVQAAPGTVLRQDSPDQTVEGPAAGTILRQDASGAQAESASSRQAPKATSRQDIEEYRLFGLES